MVAYLIRRTIATLVLLLLIITVVFMLIHLLPGDPAYTILGGLDANPSPEQIARVRNELGLDRPIYVQYVDWLGRLVRGDLGYSYIGKRAIGPDLLQRLPRTLFIIVPAILLSIILGVPLGVAAARLRRTMWDPIISAIALLGFSLPVFVTGIILVLIFALKLSVLPSGGFVHPMEDFPEFLKRAALPIVTLSLGPTATTMRMTRSSVVEQLGLDYVRTARAKGLSDRKTLYGHVLRNALMPVVTVIGLNFGAMFAGSVLVEFIFNWPGLNTYMLTAISSRDYPIVQAVVLVVSVIFVLINFLTDLSFAIIDPRIRYD